MVDISTFVCPPALIYMILIIALASFYIAYGLYRGTFNTSNVFENTSWLVSQSCAMIICCLCITSVCICNRTAAWLSITCLILSALGSCITSAVGVTIKQQKIESSTPPN